MSEDFKGGLYRVYSTTCRYDLANILIVSCAVAVDIWRQLLSDLVIIHFSSVRRITRSIKDLEKGCNLACFPFKQITKKTLIIKNQSTVLEYRQYIIIQINRILASQRLS
jgi:hypothetical protein